MSLQVIVGPMFSGKSTELSRRLRRAQIAGRSAFMFKSVLDNRYDETHVVSHDGGQFPATPIDTIWDVWRHADTDWSVIGIDEAQFFSLEGAALADLRDAAQMRDIIVAGLDMDAFGHPFSTMKELTAVADDVLKLKAVCIQCGEDAGYTQRMYEGYPITQGTPVQVGGLETYEARCIECFERVSVKEIV